MSNYFDLRDFSFLKVRKKRKSDKVLKRIYSLGKAFPLTLIKHLFALDTIPEPFFSSQMHSLYNMGIKLTLILVIFILKNTFWSFGILFTTCSKAYSSKEKSVNFMTFVLFLHAKTIKFDSLFFPKNWRFLKTTKKFFFHIFSNNEQNLMYDTPNLSQPLLFKMQKVWLKFLYTSWENQFQRGKHFCGEPGIRKLELGIDIR